MLVQGDKHVLYVSRYVHQIPIDLKKPSVGRIGDYVHCSYPAYVKQAKTPGWSETDYLYGLEGSEQRYAGMRRFAE